LIFRVKQNPSEPLLLAGKSPLCPEPFDIQG
jgi:hypothetical protein